MKKYEKPTLQVIRLEQDIITGSVGDDTTIEIPDDGIWDGVPNLMYLKEGDEY